MKPNILWIFLVTAALASASSLGSFEATCSGTGCGGSYNGNTFTFGVPFPDGRASAQPDPNFPYNPFMDFSIGTHGGTYSSGGHTCDYDVVLGGGDCDGEISFGADLGPPDATGLSFGDVVSVKGTGTAEGRFCWICSGVRPPPLFALNVIATYQFVLTNPGSSSPFTWTAAQFSSVPEPGTLVLATLGLAGVAVGRRGRRCRSQRKPDAKKNCVPDR